MKVCILSAFEDTTEKNDGPSVRVCSLAEGLAGLGNSVNLIMPGFVNNNKRISHFSAYWMRGFVPTRLLRIMQQIFGVGRSTALYFYDFLFIARATPIIRESDIVQFEQQTTGGLLIPFAKYILRKPVVVDCHDVYQALRVKNTGLIRRFLETWLEQLSYNLASKILVVSEKERTMVGKNSKKATVIPNGVDTAKFNLGNSDSETLAKFGVHSGPVVIFVGNLDYEPNREALKIISSVIAPIVAAAIPETIFLAVGKHTKSFDLSNVVLTGRVDNVEDFLAVSNVAIAPLLHGSGTRLKILEYFASGVPVVSTSIGAEGLAVENGKNIIIEDNFELFSQGIIRLLADKVYSLQIGLGGKAVSKIYDWKTISLRLRRVYQILTNN